MLYISQFYTKEHVLKIRPLDYTIIKRFLEGPFAAKFFGETKIVLLCYGCKMASLFLSVHGFGGLRVLRMDSFNNPLKSVLGT